jgi:rare lipoprotein A
MLMKRIIIYMVAFIFFMHKMTAQDKLLASVKMFPLPDVLYGTASYYGGKFNGRQAANGEVFNQNRLTAACNVLPLGTWIKVTNLRNGRVVTVKVIDRLHVRMKRVVDLSKSAAQQLGYTHAGLTKVKVEPLGAKKPLL